ncbi:hypothetical protein C0J52_24884 [Blattella germanica]|nr:hypothetical protein C0J52_24884 [Blattella germanica]
MHMGQIGADVRQRRLFLHQKKRREHQIIQRPHSLTDTQVRHLLKLTERIYETNGSTTKTRKSSAKSKISYRCYRYS